MNKNFFFFLLVIQFFPCSLGSPLTSNTTEPVETSTGKVIGRVLSNGVREFLGIPYASPPTDSLRWKPPVPHETWSTPFSAFEYGNSCVQATLPFIINFTYEPQGEDCLSLNIWAPTQPPGSPLLPILVFVHGGGFLIGSSHDPSLNGSSLSLNGPAVVVTLNYRLNVFGYLALPSLSEENPNNSTGNYGIMDQQFALEWVNKNAKQFGGDPSRLLFFGQSAGGNSMFIHLVSPLSSGLFTRLAVESGYFRGYYGLPDGYQLSENVVNMSSCATVNDTLSCLRSLPASSLINISGACQWLPVIDGYVLPDYVDLLVERGEFAHVPVIVGGVRNEGTITIDPFFGSSFGDSLYTTYTLALYTPLVGALEANRVNRFYRPEQFPSPYWALSSSFGDFNILCSSAYLANLLAQKGNEVYSFVFAYPPRSNGFYVMTDNLGAYHAAEIPFIWHTVFDFDSVEETLSSRIQSAWLHFADTGIPGDVGGFDWPLWSGSNLSSSVQFDAPSNNIQVVMGIPNRCPFWFDQPIYTPAVLLGGCGV